MQTTIITPDEARAELARLERDVAFTAGALTNAIAALAESPGDRSAVAQLVADQKAKNALAALAAARERLAPVFAAEAQAREDALTARYARHLTVVDAELEAALAGMGDACAAFVAAVHAVRDRLAEREATVATLDRRTGTPHGQVPHYAAAERMAASCRTRGLPSLWKWIWNPETGDWPAVNVTWREGSS